MKNVATELTPDELGILLDPIFQHAVTEIRDGKMELNWDYFLPEWTKWSKLGFARTWVAGDAVAGGVFTRDLFSGHPRALLMFWLSTPNARRSGAPIRALESFEKAAEQFGAKPAAALHRAISPDRLGKVYLKRGYELSELIFSR